MANLREKGKIPHGEWAAIRQRHASGESLASIARSYHCTAPAIRYILRRSGGSSGTQGSERAAALTARPGADREYRGSSPAPRRSLVSPEVHRRIRNEISLFLVALDATLNATKDSEIQILQDAADRLMRAAARLLIELEQRPGGSPPHQGARPSDVDALS